MPKRKIDPATGEPQFTYREQRFIDEFNKNGRNRTRAAAAAGYSAARIPACAASEPESSSICGQSDSGPAPQTENSSKPKPTSPESELKTKNSKLKTASDLIAPYQHIIEQGIRDYLAAHPIEPDSLDLQSDDDSIPTPDPPPNVPACERANVPTHRDST